MTIVDASFAQESETDVKGNKKEHRSQIARVTALVDPTIFSEDVANCHVISYASQTDKRVCNSTLQAEGHAMIAGTDVGDRMRAIIADMFKPLNMKYWEVESARTRPHLWLSDCRSLVDHMHNPKDERLSNTRLSIDIAGLKQLIWNKDDGTQYEELPKERHARQAIRWIDTSAMVVDCMTKKMKADVLIRTFQGTLDVRPTPESLLTKMRKQKFRQNKSNAANTADDIVPDESSVKPQQSMRDLTRSRPSRLA